MNKKKGVNAEMSSFDGADLFIFLAIALPFVVIICSNLLAPKDWSAQGSSPTVLVCDTRIVEESLQSSQGLGELSDGQAVSWNVEVVMDCNQVYDDSLIVIVGSGGRFE